MLAELVYVTEFVKYVIFFKYFLKEDIEKVWIGSAGLLAYNVIILQFDVPMGLTAVSIVVILLICMSGKFELKFCEKIIVIAAMLNCAAEIIIILVKKAIEYFWKFKLTNIEYYVITNIIFIVVILFLLFLKTGKNNINCISVNVVYGILGIVVFLLTIAVGLLKYLANYIQNKFLLTAIDIVFAFTFLSIIVLVIIVLYIYDMNDYMKKAFETEKMMRKSQQIYYETLLEKENETAKYRHDISNHILCLKEMAAAGEIEEVQSYIDSMNKQIKKINHKVYETGNMVLNIMLNYYIRNLEKETKVMVMGRVENDFMIDNYVLCTIFSNLIKNAVEEINRSQAENPEFLIVISNGRRSIKVEIKNTSGKKEIEKGLVKTSKKDSKNHGIGLKNVQKMVEKCGGIYEIKYEDEMFTVEIYLPMSGK